MANLIKWVKDRAKSVADIVDPNSEADKKRRLAAGQPAQYVDNNKGIAGLARGVIGAPIALTKQAAELVSAPVDLGRAGVAQATNNRAARAQAIASLNNDINQSIGKMFSVAPKVVNTLYFAANDGSRNRDKLISDKGGLFNQGTLFQNQDAWNKLYGNDPNKTQINPKELAKKVALNDVGLAADYYLGKSGLGGIASGITKSATKGAVEQAAAKSFKRQLLENVPTNFALGTASSAGQQYEATGKVNPREALESGIATAGGGAILQGGGYVTGKGIRAVKDTVRPLDEVGSISVPSGKSGEPQPKNALVPQSQANKKSRLSIPAVREQNLADLGIKLPSSAKSTTIPKNTQFDASNYIAEQTRLQQAAAGKPNGLKAAKNEFAVKALDALSPIEKPVEKAAGGRENTVALRNQLDRSLRSNTIAGQYAKDNGLHEVINSVDNTKAFDQYLIAKHAADLEANGIKTGRNAVADSQLVTQLSPKYEAQAQAIQKYNHSLLDKTVDYGLISRDTAEYLKQKYPNYVPFDRIFADGELTSVGNGAGPASLSKQTVIQRIKGSERQIHSPLESTLAKTHDVIAQGERNLAARAIVDTAKLPGNPLNIKPLRTAADVNARVDLYTQAKELKPVQAKLSSMLSSRSKWANRLQQELDRLNKKGIDVSLSQQKNTTQQPILSGVRESIVNPKKVTNPTRDIPTLTGKLETTQFTRSMSASETKAMVNNLISKTPAELAAIKAKIATRENKLAPVLDEIKDIQTVLEGVKNNRQALFDEAKLHADAQARGQSTISTLRDGIKEIYQVSPEVAQAAKSLNKQQLGLVGKILSYPTRALRLGATGANPAFAAANMIKDSASMFINSRHPVEASLANPKVFLKALSAAFNHNGEAYAELVREGAGGTSFDIARNNAKDSIAKIRAERNVATKVAYTVRHPGELLRAVEDTIGRSEEYGRAMQYFGNKEAALKSGKGLKEATAYGADAARNNTVNFARAGEYGRVLNSVLPYFNAGIQGSRTFLRNVRDRPVQTGAKVALTAFLPVATTTAWNLNDPKRKEAYDDIQEYEKQGNIIIVPPNPHKDPKTGRWNVIKIPVSQEVANLNNIVRNGIEAMHKDQTFNFPQMAGDLTGTATSLNVQNPRQLVGQVTPQAIKPGIESLTNQNLFTGNKIVPDSMKNLDPKDQYGKQTSGTARVIGGVTNISPFKIDNTIKTSLGGLGSNLINLSDNALAKAGAIKPEDIRGTSFSTGIGNRFNSAQGQSEYAPIDKALKEKMDQLKALPGYKTLSPDEKAKALSRLQNDVVTSTKRQIDAKNGTGQYSPDFTGKQDKLSTRQAGLLDGTTDVASYLTPQTASGSRIEVSKNIPKQYQDTLTKFSGLDSKSKDDYLSKNPSAEYDLAAAKLENDKANNSLSRAEQIRRESELSKLAVGKDTPKEIRDLYSLSKAQVKHLIETDPNGQSIADQLVAYGDKLEQAGVADNKFRTSKGAVSFGNGKSGKKKSGKKGRKRKAVPQAALTAAIKIPSVGKVRQASFRVSNPATPTFRVPRKKIPTMKQIATPRLKTSKKLS